MKNAILEVRNLKKYFPQKKGILSRTIGYTKAIDGIDLFVEKGQTLGLVGESGSGKTTTGRCILRLIEPTEGSVYFMNKNILELNDQSLRKLRRKMQIVFQDPFSSFNPRMTAGKIIAEPLIVHRLIPKMQLKDRIKELMEEVGIDPSYYNRYPHEFSGGQRQRIGIARAIALNPSLIVADEPVSALDVSVQAQIMNLMYDLKEKHELSYLFISHDLSIVKFISDRIAVMYLGKIIETGFTETIFNNPLHPYTRSLLNAIPNPFPDSVKKVSSTEASQENNSDPAKKNSSENKSTGCIYYSKCSNSRDECREAEQNLEEVKGDQFHFTSCIRYDRI